MPATISVNFASQAEVENSPQPTNKSVSAKVLADVLGGGSLGGGYVRIAGSTMTGALTLNAAPTSDLHAATKKYVDDNSKQAKYYYNIAAPTSTVSGPDNSSPSRTLDFTTTVGVDVYRNGVLLVGNGVDYTANVSTKTITFTTALAAGAIIQVNVGGVGTTIAPAPGVAQIVAGDNIEITPTGGTGVVTVTSPDVSTRNRRFTGITKFSNDDISAQTFSFNNDIDDVGQRLLIADGDGTGNATFAQIRYSINDNTRNRASYLKLAKSASNTIGENVKVTGGMPIGGVAMFGCDRNGTNARYIAGASIDAEVAAGSNANITNNCVPMRLRFCTRGVGETGALSERMSIGSAGNVTINNNLEVGGNITQVGGLPFYGCRAWVNFSGTRNTSNVVDGSNTARLIRARGNVSGVTKLNTGDYRVEFDVDMPNTNYSVSVSVADGQARPSVVRELQTGFVRVGSADSNTGQGYDHNIVCVQVFF